MDTVLKYYSSKEVQKNICELAKNKEIAVKYSDKGFGKRPDVVQFPSDVKELAKQGATSFHCSEENWDNPLNLSTDLSRKKLDDLRLNWDLILDVDCKFIEYSKIATYVLVEAIKFNGIKNISVKFSGGSGFHIGIPAESFPGNINNQKTKNLFPEAPKAIAEYLKNLIKTYLSEQILSISSLKQISKSLNKKEDDFLETICNKCEKVVKEESLQFEVTCDNCGRKETNFKLDQGILICLDCRNEIIIKNNYKPIKIKKICVCGNDKLFSKGNFNPFKIVDIDSQLISSRHMFRMPYSINEKTNLVSIPIEIKNIKEFDPKDAKISNIENIKIKFLDRDFFIKDEAKQLILQSFDFISTQNKPKIVALDKNYPLLEKEIPEALFPECITKLLIGVKEDGRKRGIFVLISFLQNMNWPYDKILNTLIDWNKKNYEPLKENYILSQINWFKRQNKKILPPNCDNESYYKTMSIYCFNCKYKNPVNYVKIKLKNEKNKR